MMSNTVSRIGIIGLVLLANFASCSDKDTSKKQMDSSEIIDSIGNSTPLVCPGAKGCVSASGELRVGAAAVAITPTIETWEDTNSNGRADNGEAFDDLNGNGEWDPVWLAGFGTGRAASGVHDDIWARAVTFEQGEISMAIVSLDLVGFFHPDVVQIRLDAKEAGLDFDHIMITSTHQHDGPDTMGIWGGTNLETGYDPEYIAVVRQKVVQALGKAKQGAKPSTFKVGLTSAPEFINDTRLPIVIDQALHGLHFVDEAGAPITTVVFWGNHPEALGSGSTLLTSDFPHYTREKLEAHYPGSVAVYVSGIMGGLMTTIGLNICPDSEGNDTCPQGTFERAKVVGDGVADALIKSLESPDVPSVTDGTLGLRRYPFFLKTTNPIFSLGLTLGILTRRVYEVETETRIEGPDLMEIGYADILEGKVKFDTEVNHLKVGPVEILTVPGELYPELWLEKEDGQTYIERPDGADFPDAPFETPLQSLLGDDSFKIIVNQGNDSVGYIMPKAQYDAARPRAYEEDGQYGEENSIGADVAPTLLENILKMFELKAD